jgi:hypothetical protein
MRDLIDEFHLIERKERRTIRSLHLRSSPAIMRPCISAKVMTATPCTMLPGTLFLAVEF